MRLPLERERELIAKCRELAPVFYGFDPDQVQAELRSLIGIARLDQFKAATEEVTKRLREEGETRRVTMTEGLAESPEAQDFAMVLYAGIMRCFAGTYCKHAQEGGRPLAVVLRARLISCQACMPSYLGLVFASDAAAVAGAEARLCDFCLEETSTFRETQVAYGPALLLGDACERCVEAGQSKAAA